MVAWFEQFGCDLQYFKNEVFNEKLLFLIIFTYTYFSIQVSFNLRNTVSIYLTNLQIRFSQMKEYHPLFATCIIPASKIITHPQSQ